MKRVCAITTFDNPFDPIENFLDWYLFDEDKGYHTCAYLGRIARCSDEFTDEENERIQEEAIDEIIKYDMIGIYKKVVKQVAENQLTG